MSIESAGDWAGLREVGHIAHLTLEALERGVRPGVTTADLDHVAAGVFLASCRAVGPGSRLRFPRHRSDQRQRRSSARHPRIAADRARRRGQTRRHGRKRRLRRGCGPNRAGGIRQQTWPKRLTACAAAAFEAALVVARAGNPVSSIGRAVEREVRRSGFTVIRSLQGHGVGRTIHEPPSVPNYYDRWQQDILTEGLVITIEPIISAGSARIVEDPTVDDSYSRRQPVGPSRTHDRHYARSSSDTTAA